MGAAKGAWVCGGPAHRFAQSVRQHWRLYLYAIILMAAAATFSHGTQDLYPTLLREQHGLTLHPGHSDQF